MLHCGKILKMDVDCGLWTNAVVDFRECSVADMGDAFVTLFKLQNGSCLWTDDVVDIQECPLAVKSKPEL